MTLPESETVDHPWKREEKIQNTDSHSTFKLEQPTQLVNDVWNIGLGILGHSDHCI